MASMTVKVAKDNTEAVESTFQRAILTALEECGLVGEAYAVANITIMDAVDTGRLRGSITHGVDNAEKVAYIGTNVEYAAYVEFGTSKMPARPYLKNAVNDHMDEYRDIIKTRLENA